MDKRPILNQKQVIPAWKLKLLEKQKQQDTPKEEPQKSETQKTDPVPIKLKPVQSVAPKSTPEENENKNLFPELKPVGSLGSGSPGERNFFAELLPVGSIGNPNEKGNSSSPSSLYNSHSSNKTQTELRNSGNYNSNDFRSTLNQVNYGGNDFRNENLSSQFNGLRKSGNYNSNDFCSTLNQVNTSDPMRNQFLRDKSDERQKGIDYSENLVKPAQLNTSQVILSEEEILKLPDWQQAIVRKKQQDQTKVESEKGHTLTSSELAARDFQRRQALKAGKPLEPIIPGIPAWKQRVKSSSNRVKAGYNEFKKIHEGVEGKNVSPRSVLKSPRESSEKLTVSSTLAPNTDIRTKRRSNSRSSGKLVKPTPVSFPTTAETNQSVVEAPKVTDTKIETSTDSLWERKIVESNAARRNRKGSIAVKRNVDIKSTERGFEIIDLVAPEEFNTGEFQFEIILEEKVSSTVLAPVLQIESTEEVIGVKKSTLEMRKEIEAEERMVKDIPEKEEKFKKAAWHEQYKASTLVKQKLADKSLVLETLLVDPESLLLALGDSKENKVLLNYLSKLENIDKMLGYVVVSPVLASHVQEDKIESTLKELKISETCLQILISSPTILSKIINNADFLKKIFLHIKEMSTHFLVYARLVQILMIIFMLEANKIVTHIITNEPDFIDSLVAKVGTPYLLEEDALMVMRLLMKAEKKAPQIVDWLLNEKLITKLMNRLNDSEGIIALEQITSILGEVLAEAKIYGDERAENNEDNRLCDGFIAQFSEESVMDSLFSEMTTSEKVLCPGLKLLTIAVEAEIEGEDSMILLKLIDNIGSFLDKLQNSDGKKGLGFSRLAIIQFLLVIATEEPDICTILIENGFYSSFLDLLFAYPANSILHDSVLQLFLLLCDRGENEIMEALIQTNLLDRIGGVWKDYNMSGKHKEKHLAYFGHLAVISNMIIDLSSDQIPSIEEIIEISSEWQQHTEPFIDDYNMTMISLISAKNV